MGVLPAAWLLLPGRAQPPRPVGVLVHQSRSDAGACGAGHRAPPQLFLDAAGSEGPQPALHLSVYAVEDGTVLQQRLDVQQGQEALLEHPCFGVPAWDSG
jgi:hypothetical protein